MNPREKRMVFVLGGMLALLAVYTVQKQYRGKLGELDGQIKKLQQTKQEIEFDQRRLKLGKEQWADAGGESLGLDEGKAKNDFRPDIDALVAEVGLTEATVTLKNVEKKGKNGLRSLNCSVGAEGNLESILKFLFRVHQRPYVVRLRDVAIDRLPPKKGQKPTEALLRLTAGLDTLLLPDAHADGLPKVTPVDITSRPAEPPSRTKFAKFDDYQDIIKRKIFEPWTPPIPPPGKVAGHVPGPSQQLAVNAQQLRWNAAPYAKTYEVFLGEENPPPSVRSGHPVTNFQPAPPLVLGKTYYWKIDSINEEGVRTEGDVIQFTVYQPTTPQGPVVEEKKPEPPPADQNLILARIVSSDRGQQVVLEDPVNKQAEDKRIEVGEDLYGGTLVFVHPKGAVSLKGEELRYHPITKALRECVPLSDETQPELNYEVMKLEQRAAGISQRPG